MLDFLKIEVSHPKKNETIVKPSFKIMRSNDLMIRGQAFYAIWDEAAGLWSTDEYRAVELIDKEIHNFVENDPSLEDAKVCYLRDSSSGSIDSWHKYCQKQAIDMYTNLDEKLVYANDVPNKKDYASKRLPYDLEDGSFASWDKLISTLYSPEERHKIEWAIGSIVCGDSKWIQKFVVLYGSAGTGKSTILNVIQKLFAGYYNVFDAKALGSSSASFALESFRSNPLVAIQHDGDLSRIEDNTRLNSLVSHELMTVNEKFKATYTNKFKSFLFMGTNKPVMITDSKSGLLRRLIDVSPSGNKLPIEEYDSLMKRIDFELGSIAVHCRDVYFDDPNFYDSYRPTMMMEATNDFFDFMISEYSRYLKDDHVTAKGAWAAYKEYAEEANMQHPYSYRKFREELRTYFKQFKEQAVLDDGTHVRNLYVGFRSDRFGMDKKDAKSKSTDHLIDLQERESILDKELAECPAQYANENEAPCKKWENVKTKLSDIDTSKIHYVKVPENHIVIDFDLKDESGAKSPIKNLEEASKWPSTYAELSKGGAGIHLHYIYTGDVSKLSKVYDENIEIKVFKGNSALRRRLTKCNNLPIATISTGLPLKGEDKMVNFDALKNEKALRTLIRKNLNKEIHPSTKSSIDFIAKILDDAYNSDMHYDVSDLSNDILAFAAQSTHQSEYCIKKVSTMQFKSAEASVTESNEDAPIVFYDVEVFPNLFLVNYKFEGEDKPVIRMINPTPAQIEELMQYRLVGYNCRRYDNHIMYGRMIGYSNEKLYNLSQNIVSSNKGARGIFFSEAYNLSYTDIYDFAAKKQSLKKWEIELGIHHQELGLPWDQPVPETMWEQVAEYCDNDVIATEAVWNHLQPDFLARKILADIAGLTPNDTTNSLTTRIIFGTEKHPKLEYTNLEETFEGYMFSTWGEYYDKYPEYMAGVDARELERRLKDNITHNLYRGTDLGFGGYVYAQPGMYTNVALLDVASLHPHSIKAMNCFGEYTKNFTDIMDARIFIKHGDYESARKLFDGKLAKYLDDPSTAKQLAQALKIAINSVYGLTSASFDNPFRDERNKNNIVALRGALFMRLLQDEVTARGFTVAHIKTDSIKIPDASPEIIDFCMNFARLYGYDFEHEATYKKMCLVNNAVYIAQYQDCEHYGEWTATGAQFAVPYVFKTLFSHEPIEFEDMCETKSVTSCMYLDMNEGMGTDEHNRVFVGKIGEFCPIKRGHGGGLLVRSNVDKDGNEKFDSVVGTKDYRWLESERVRAYGTMDDIDRSYYDKLVDDAVDAMGKYGDVEWFLDNDSYGSCIPDTSVLMELPWKMPCGRDTCMSCPNMITKDLPLAVGCRDGYDNSGILAPTDDDDDGRAFSVR